MGLRQFRSDDTSYWAERFCGGEEGDLVISTDTVDSTPKTSASGSDTATVLTVGSTSGFSAGRPIFIVQAIGTLGTFNWELNVISSIGSGLFNLKYPLTRDYSSSGNNRAIVYQPRRYRNVTVNLAVTWSWPGFDGSIGGYLPFFFTGTFTNNGTIGIPGANGAGVSPGNIGSYTTQGGFRGGIGASNHVNQADSTCGEGSGGPPRTFTSNTSGSGGGGNADTAGAGGGNRTAGTDGSGNTGGAAVLDSDLKILLPGGGGGSGSAGLGAANGANGGAAMLAIGRKFVNAGSFNFNGGSGAQPPSGNGRASAPGAGGAFLGKFQIAQLATGITLLPGGTASGSEGNSTAAGNGLMHIDYLVSPTGSANPSITSRQDFTLADKGGSILNAFL